MNNNCGAVLEYKMAIEGMDCPYCGGPVVPKQPKPLLTIELETETSVPKVIYKGEEITHKVNVAFDWDTETDTSMGGLTFAIEHLEKSGKDRTVNRIERRIKGHAL